MRREKNKRHIPKINSIHFGGQWILLGIIVGSAGGDLGGVPDIFVGILRGGRSDPGGIWSCFRCGNASG